MLTARQLARLLNSQSSIVPINACNWSPRIRDPNHSPVRTDAQERLEGGRKGGREGGSGHSLPLVSWPPGRLEGLVWRGTSRLGVASLWAMPPSSSEVFSPGLVGQLAAHQVSSKGERLLLQGRPSGLHNHLPSGNKARPWAPKHPNTLTVRFSGAEGDGEFPLWCHKPKFRTSA